MDLLRRRVAAALASAPLVPGVARGAAPSGDTPLPAPTSWRGALRAAQAEGRPLVVLFSTPGCPWCRTLRRDVLHHLVAQSDARGVRVFELDLTDNRPFADGTGDSPASVARGLAARVSPTVVFIGPRGELAERLVGYPSPDFYNAYLDDRIARARTGMAGG
jgi:thiol-disulfide isomerase/thioredoxin